MDSTNVPPPARPSATVWPISPVVNIGSSTTAPIGLSRLKPPVKSSDGVCEPSDV